MNGERQVKLPSEHPLMAYATRRPYRTAPFMPDNVLYDSTKGYWLMGSVPMVASDEFAEGCSGSKKHDLETGEDLKGE